MTTYRKVYKLGLRAISMRQRWKDQIRAYRIVYEEENGEKFGCKQTKSGTSNSSETFNKRSSKPKYQYSLDQVIKDQNQDPIQKLVAIRNIVSEGKQISREEYESLIGLSKDLVKEYETGRAKAYVKKDLPTFKFAKDTLEGLNQYLRSEHQRLQNEIYKQTSLDKVIENKNTSKFDVRKRLGDINAYLTSGQNVKADQKNLKEIKEAYDHFANDATIEFAIRRGQISQREFSETLHNIVNYASKMSDGKLVQGNKPVEKTPQREKPSNIVEYKQRPSKLGSLGKIAAGIAFATTALFGSKAHAPDLEQRAVQPVAQNTTRYSQGKNIMPKETMHFQYDLKSMENLSSVVRLNQSLETITSED